MPTFAPKDLSFRIDVNTPVVNTVSRNHDSLQNCVYQNRVITLLSVFEETLAVWLSYIFFPYETMNCFFKVFKIFVMNLAVSYIDIIHVFSPCWCYDLYFLSDLTHQALEGSWWGNLKIWNFLQTCLLHAITSFISSLPSGRLWHSIGLSDISCWTLGPSVVGLKMRHQLWSGFGSFGQNQSCLFYLVKNFVDLLRGEGILFIDDNFNRGIKKNLKLPIRI